MRPRYIVPLLALSLACAESNGPDGSTAKQIEAIGATQFTATPLDTVTGWLTVRVTDPLGKSLPGVPVTWSTQDGGTLIPVSATTDAEGQVQAAWILGWHPGAQQAHASVAAAPAAVTFAATAVGFQAQGLSTGDGDHICGIALDQRLYCWGPNNYGQLGDGTTTDSDIPVLVQLAQPVKQVVTDGDAYGSPSTCALTVGGEVYCWGNNASGQLGNGTQAPSSIPVRVELLNGPYKHLDNFAVGACAIATSGDAYCWGRNRSGRFGAATTPLDVLTPTLVLGGFAWQDFSLGDDRSCGIRVGGEVYCWGGQPEWLGTRADTATNTPLPVVHSPLLDSVTVGGYHQCGITSDHHTYCWGYNFHIGKIDPRTIIPDPMELDSPPLFVSLHSIFKPTFGLGADGRGYWWGPPPNSSGGGPEAPEPFTGPILIKALGTAAFDVCGVERASSTVFCWNGTLRRAYAVPPS